MMKQQPFSVQQHLQPPPSNCSSTTAVEVKSKAVVPCVAVQLRFRAIYGGNHSDGGGDESGKTSWIHRVEVEDLEGTEDEEGQGEMFYFVRKFHKLLSPDVTPNCYSCVLYGTSVEVFDFLWQYQDIYVRITQNDGSIPLDEEAAQITFSMRELISTDADFSKSFYENETQLDHGEKTIKLMVRLRLEAYEIPADSLNARRSFLSRNMTKSCSLCLTIQDDKCNHDLLELCANDNHDSPVRIGVRCSLAQQYIQMGASMRCKFYLIMVETWEEVMRYLRCIRLNVVLPSTPDNKTERLILPLDSKPLRLKISQKCNSYGFQQHSSIAAILTSSPHPHHEMALTFSAELHCSRVICEKSDVVKAAIDRRVVRPPPNMRALSNYGEAVNDDTSSRMLDAVNKELSNEEVSKLRTMEEGMYTEDVDGSRWHTWRFSIDCLAIQLNFSASKIYVKYELSAFGALKPFLTQPAVECRKNEMTRLYNGFCAYTFTQSSLQLREQMIQNPLLLQIWSRDIYKEDQLVGETFVTLSSILSQPVLTSSDDGVSRIPYRSIDGIYYLQCDDTSTPQGFLRCQFFLEDLGPVSSRSINETTRTNIIHCNEIKQDTEIDVNLPMSEAADVMRNSNLTKLEMDAWKEKESYRVIALLQKKEAELLHKLEEQFRQKDNERQKEFESKRNQLHQLETQLRRKAQELQQQAEELESQQMKLSHEQEDLRIAMHRNSDEYMASCRRLKQEHEKTMQLEADKNRELNERKIALQTELEETRAHVRELEKETFELKQQLYNSPSYPLLSDLKVKSFEVEDLKTKLEAMTSSRDHFLTNCTALLERFGDLKRQETQGNSPAWREDFGNRLEVVYRSMQSLQSMLAEAVESSGSQTESNAYKRNGRQSRASALRNLSDCAPAHKSAPSMNGSSLMRSNRKMVTENRVMGDSRLASSSLPPTATEKKMFAAYLNRTSMKPTVTQQINTKHSTPQRSVNSRGNTLTDEISTVAQFVNPNGASYLAEQSAALQKSIDTTHLPPHDAWQLLRDITQLSTEVKCPPKQQKMDIHDENATVAVTADEGGFSIENNGVRIPIGAHEYLKNEIDRLLKSGVYTENDKTIENMRDRLQRIFNS